MLRPVSDAAQHAPEPGGAASVADDTRAPLAAGLPCRAAPWAWECMERLREHLSRFDDIEACPVPSEDPSGDRQARYRTPQICLSCFVVPARQGALNERIRSPVQEECGVRDVSGGQALVVT
jgi:hypothetical protein